MFFLGWFQDKYQLFDGYCAKCFSMSFCSQENHWKVSLGGHCLLLAKWGNGGRRPFGGDGAWPSSTASAEASRTEFCRDINWTVAKHSYATANASLGRRSVPWLFESNFSSKAIYGIETRHQCPESFFVFQNCCLYHIILYRSIQTCQVNQCYNLGSIFPNFDYDDDACYATLEVGRH